MVSCLHARGEPQIEVTFDIDANGILHVSAKDKATNKEQSIRIEASSGLSEAEIKRMKDEAAANAEADAREREKVDKMNAADSLIFQTEKQLNDIGDKIPADKRGPIDAALAKLKEAHKSQDIAAIDAATNELNTAFQAASQDMYNAQNAQGGQPGWLNAPRQISINNTESLCLRNMAICFKKFMTILHRQINCQRVAPIVLKNLNFLIFFRKKVLA
jgi:molecular chaperone DnaK